MVRMFMLMILAMSLVSTLSLPVFVFNVIRKTILGHSLKDYFKTIAIGFDQAGGSIIYAQENFTISSYTYYLCKKKNNICACDFMKLIDLIFGMNHCKESYKNEIERDSKSLKEIS